MIADAVVYRSPDSVPDAYWLGRNEDPMIALVEFIDAGGSWDELPDKPQGPGLNGEKAMGASGN